MSSDTRERAPRGFGRTRSMAAALVALAACVALLVLLRGSREEPRPAIEARRAPPPAEPEAATSPLAPEPSRTAAAAPPAPGPAPSAPDERPLGELVVQVLATDGSPVEGAYVRVDPMDPVSGRPLPPPPGWKRFEMPGFYTMASLHSEDVLRAGTDERGELHVAGLPCGEPLLVSASLAVVPTSARVTIDPVERRARVVLEGETAGSLRGVARWSDGAPAAGLLLELRPEPYPTGLRELPEHGTFLYRGLQPGPYVLEVRGRPEAGRALEIEPGVEQVLELTLERSARVSGRIVLESAAGERAPLVSGDGLMLSVFQRGRLLMHQRVDPDGRFSFEAAPGPLRLLPRSRNEPAWTRWQPVEAVAPDAELELVLAGDLGRIQVVEPDFDAAKASALVFLGEEGADEPAAARAFAERHRVLRRSLRVAEDGALWIENLPPGVHGVQLLVEGEGAAWLPALRVAPMEVTRVERPAVGFGSVCGSVAGGSAEGVVLAAPTGKARLLSVDAEGRFQLDDLPAGPYRLQPATWCARAEDARYLEVEVGGELALEPFAAPGGELDCRVERGGAPVVGARLWLERPDGEDIWQAGARSGLRTDEDGRVTFRGVRGGAVRVVLPPLEEDPGVWHTATVHLEEGGRAEAHFELPVERLRLSFRAGGERLTDIEGLNVLSEDRARTSYAPAEDGWVRLDPIEGPALLVVVRAWPASLAARPGERLSHLVRVTEELRGEERQLELVGATLALRPRGFAAWLEPPSVELLELDGRPVAPAGAPVPLWMEALDAGGVRVPHLPPGARVRVRVALADGQLVERELEIDSNDPLELVLP